MSRRRSSRSVAGAVAACLAAFWLGCDGAPEGAVAVFDDGTITQTQLDERIRSLPRQQRRPPEGNLEDWESGVIRDLAVEEIVLAEARERFGKEGTPQGLEESFAEIERRAAVGAYLAQHLSPPEPLTEKELRDAFEDWAESYRQGEKRLVWQIFLNVPTGGSPESVEARMRELRSRILDGQSFRRLATEFSESETRHREGQLGWFGRGELAPALEQVVFDLPVQEPSRPIRTSAGIHMFWVDAVQPETAHTFEEVRSLVARRLATERRDLAIQALATSEPPPDSFVPEPRTLAALLGGDDPEAVILRIGDFEFRLRQLRSRLAQQAEAGAGPMAILRSLEVRELLYRQCLDDGCDEEPRVREAVVGLRRDAIVQFELRRRLRERVLADRELVGEYYERNRRRYLEPVRWRVTRALFPLGASPPRRMARVESATAALNAGEETLEQLVADLGGTIEDLGWKPLAALQADSPAMSSLLAELTAGGHTPPVRHGDRIEVLRCDERLDPQVLPIERVEQRLADDLIQAEGQDLYRTMREEILRAHGFRILADRARG